MSEIVVSTAGVVPESFYTLVYEHLRTSGAPDDDNILRSYARAAVEDFELHTGQSVYNQTRTMYVDGWYKTTDLKTAPVKSVTSIKYHDINGTLQTLDSSSYFTSLNRYVPAIVMKPDFEYPELEDGNPLPVQIELSCGYDDIDIPELILTSLMFYTGILYDNRDFQGAQDLSEVRNKLFNRFRLNFLGQ